MLFVSPLYKKDLCWSTASLVSPFNNAECKGWIVSIIRCRTGKQHRGQRRRSGFWSNPGSAPYPSYLGVGQHIQASIRGEKGRRKRIKSVSEFDEQAHGWNKDQLPSLEETPSLTHCTDSFMDSRAASSLSQTLNYCIESGDIYQIFPTAHLCPDFQSYSKKTQIP